MNRSVSCIRAIEAGMGCDIVSFDLGATPVDADPQIAQAVNRGLEVSLGRAAPAGADHASHRRGARHAMLRLRARLHPARPARAHTARAEAVRQRFECHMTATIGALPTPVPGALRALVRPKHARVDARAIAVGARHGACKFSRQPAGDTLDVARIAAIDARIPNTRLVMRGSSSVPQAWLATIRSYGGDISRTHGVPVEGIRRGIHGGVREIDIDTDIRLAMTSAVRKVMFEKPAEFDPRAFPKAATAAARGVVQARLAAFGCAGQASDIKVMPPGVMAQRYAAEDDTLRRGA
jgi:hypothetical protein